jgi:hypothetical protein
MEIYIARNNGTVIGWNVDFGNLAEEAMVYEEITGNRVTIQAGTMAEVPEAMQPEKV